ncbi:MAG: preprotein translocase subunit SecE [Desulfobacteraceae bacterium]
MVNKNYKKGTKKTNKSKTDNSSKSVSVSNESSKVSKKGQQSPVKKASESKSKKQSQRVNVFKISAQFLRDARTELRKVKWPTRKELLASTTMVIILVLIIALYLGLVDIALIKILNLIMG